MLQGGNGVRERNSRLGGGGLPTFGVPLEVLHWALEMGFLASWQLITIKTNILNMEI